MERTKNGLEKNESRGNDVLGEGQGQGDSVFDGTAPPLASVLMCVSVYTNNNIFLNYAHENNIKRMRSIGRRTEKVMIKNQLHVVRCAFFWCPLVPLSPLLLCDLSLPLVYVYVRYFRWFW